VLQENLALLLDGSEESEFTLSRYLGRPALFYSMPLPTARASNRPPLNWHEPNTVRLNPRLAELKLELDSPSSKLSSTPGSAQEPVAPEAEVFQHTEKDRARSDLLYPTLALRLVWDREVLEKVKKKQRKESLDAGADYLGDAPVAVPFQ